MYTPFRFGAPSDVFRDEFRQFLTPSALSHTRQLGGVFPPVNIYDDGEAFLVRAELPGVEKEALDVNCKQNQIVIRGERPYEAVEESANFHRRERDSGQFRRAITLPQPIDAKNVSASYKNGVLEIYAPRAEEAKLRQIKISSK